MNDKLMWEAPCGCIVEITGDWWHGDGFVIEEVYIEHYCQEDKWINIKDRLPDKTDHYLVAYHLFKHKLSVTKAYYILGAGWDYYDGYNNDITHWMPIPLPPKEE